LPSPGRIWLSLDDILVAARQRGLAVPREVSVVGLDNIESTARSDPPLTTVSHSAFENGRLTAQLLLDGGPPQQLMIPVQLLIRGSTAVPRTNRQ
jgi:DNA-binding LacI/PurR family transcriptional regulator